MNKLLKKIINKNPYIQYFFGCKYYKEGNIEKALQHIKKVIESKPEYSYAIHLLMSIGIVLNDETIIADAFELVYNKLKKSQLDYLAVVSGLVYLEQYEHAQKYLKRINKKKYKKDVILIKANIAAKKKQYKKALDIIKEIGDLRSIRDPYILINIAKYMIESGDKDDALFFLKKASQRADNIVKDYIDGLYDKYYKE